MELLSSNNSLTEHLCNIGILDEATANSFTQVRNLIFIVCIILFLIGLLSVVF